MLYSKVTVTVNGEVAGETMDFDPEPAAAEEAFLEFLDAEMGDDVYAETEMGDDAMMGDATETAEKERARREADAARIRKMNSKRKQPIARKLKGNGDRKRTSFDYQEARAANNLPPAAPPQQIANAIVPPIPKSPLKKQLKEDVKELKKDVKGKAAVIFNLEKKEKRSTTKINALDMSVKELTAQLRAEKKASNLLIMQSIDEAEATMVAANLIMKDANKQRSDAQASILAEKERSNDEVRKERVYSQRMLDSRKFCVHHSTSTVSICLITHLFCFIFLQ